MGFSDVSSWARNALNNPTPLDIIIFTTVLCSLLWQSSRFLRSKPTKLPGPPAQSWFFGVSKVLFKAGDSALLLEEWAEKYGPVYRIPTALGSSRVVLCDPKAVSHFYARESIGFKRMKESKILIERLFGHGILAAEGESHKRQRKALTPAFSNQAIRPLLRVFFDSAHKLKVAWDGIIDGTPSGETLIDVQSWMNYASLDTIGIAGFAHDFGTLQGQRAKVADVFESFTRINPKGPTYRSVILSLFIPLLPLLAKLPTRFTKVVDDLNDAMERISDDLLTRTREDKKENRINTGQGPKSIIETLIIAEGAESELTLSETEVLAQIKTLILAGYETTSISLTWALINLCLQPEIQDRLRSELSQLTTDPTFEQLNTSLPYLDSVTKETLRLHPPLGETIRYAARDEIIPLSVPLTTPQGKVVDNVHIAAGTKVTAPIRLMNRSKAIWGEDAHEFVPMRWMSLEGGLPDLAKEIHGYSHILTFTDGPRICLGKQFAILEFKAVLSTLIRNFEFSLKDGANTKFDKVMGILPRPKVAGEEGTRVPLLVKRLD